MTSLATRIGGMIAVFALAALPAAGVSAQSDPVVAKVNGAEVKQSDLNAAEEELAGQLPPMTADAKRDYLVTYVADMMLVAKAAEDRKLGETEEFKRKLASARSKLLMEALLQAEAKAAVTDEAMRKVYDEAIKQMADEEEISARHILVETEDEAKKILADLKKGADFVVLAKEKSKDPGSKENGGDLGFFSKEQMVPEFAEAAFKLDKGQLSDPVKTQFGWHVIRVDDKRKKQPPEFDKVKDQIQTFVQRRAQAEMITKLRQEAKIERLDTKPDDKSEAKPADPAKK